VQPVNDFVGIAVSIEGNNRWGVRRQLNPDPLGNSNRFNSALLLMLVFLLAACSKGMDESTATESAIVDYGLLMDLPDESISYADQVKPILDKRCVVCHGCFDAPCQLKLSSHAGITRGAHKLKVYDGARVRAVQPTRLYIDARSDDEWRAMDFFPVLNEGEASPDENLRGSVLYRMLQLKQLNPQPRSGLLPASFDLELDRDQFCTRADEFPEFADEHPLWGMPYAMPNLDAEEYATLVKWIAQGSPASPLAEPSPETVSQIEEWQRFLNGSSMKEQLMSRYIYEHLFVGHIHFAGTDDREFYRLIRSRTPPDEPADEIATVRPFGDPGSGRFYYRLIRFQASIVAKSHIVYTLSDEKLDRYRELFLAPDYAVDELPGYDPEVASNPFVTFAAIPADSRYRFLLDDARYFMQGFIRGPVCRGQTALNVIEDHFWVAFFNPDNFAVIERSGFLESVADVLQFPAARGSSTLNLIAIWTDYSRRQNRYIAAKLDMLQRLPSRDIENAIDVIWDGDGDNPNAALTIFRHFDSASVVHGFVGDYPQSAWIIDYPLFERIHYLLVAGFDVFGNVGHQLNTRLYMDFLRMEGEDDFLLLLPPATRQSLRQSWYQGNRARRKNRLFAASDEWSAIELVTGFRTDDPQRELYDRLERLLGDMAGPVDYLNRCATDFCASPEWSAGKRKVAEAMRRLPQLRGAQLRPIPDVTFIRVKNIDGDGEDAVYTVLMNKGFSNVTSIFADEQERDIDDDTLTVVDGFVGAYPNFFLSFDASRIDEFVERWLAIESRKDYEEFVARFSIRRTHPNFWAEADWFHAEYARLEPVESGLFDLIRYQNR
jgi:hypothetical protein